MNTGRCKFAQADKIARGVTFARADNFGGDTFARRVIFARVTIFQEYSFKKIFQYSFT